VAMVSRMSEVMPERTELRSLNSAEREDWTARRSESMVSEREWMRDWALWREEEAREVMVWAVSVALWLGGHEF
jgi:hypothetical protein